MKCKSPQGLAAKVRSVLRKHGYEVATKNGSMINKIAVSTQSSRYAYQGNIFINQMNERGWVVREIERELLTVLHQFDPELHAMKDGIAVGRTYIKIPYELES